MNYNMETHCKHYMDDAINETFYLLRKYCYNSEATNVLQEIINNESSEQDKSLFMQAFGKFLNTYFNAYKPLDNFQKNYFKLMFRKNEKLKFNQIINKVENKRVKSFSLNVFNTFFKLNV